MTRRILIVDDDRAFRLSTAELLRQEGHEIEMAADARTGGEALAGNRFDLVLLDLRMPGVDGLGVVEVLRRRGESVPILMVSGFGSIETAVRSLQLGADDFLSKPVDPDVLVSRVADLLERRPLQVDEDPLGIVGRAPAMRDVLEAMHQVAPMDTTVLLTGETGTGKELFARGIHATSPRAGHPFVPVNCAGLADGLLETELFGHVRGAFTGAVVNKPGLFVAADRGTIFLDEVGDMTLRLQQRLLRVLQEREITPVGAVEPRPVDVRVVAATHRDLREEVESGRFREDLFYRLNVFPIRLPPLRRRMSDLPLLVERVLGRLRPERDRGTPLTVSALAMRLLMAHDWPGNVRELFAAIESAGIRARGEERIQAQHLPAAIRERGHAEETRYRAAQPGAEEKAAVRAALRETDGVRTRAAELLGMSRTTLWRKMREYDLVEEAG